MKQPKVSIIIPVYNSAKYIEKCLISLFEQTLDDLEYLFIIDGSTDSSLDVLKKMITKYPQRKLQVKIFKNETNKGTAVSRNIGVLNASGAYIIHCDSDDWIAQDMYQEMYEKAVSEDFDMVYCDYYRVINGKATHKKSKNVYSNIHAIKSILSKSGNVTGFLWDKLVKKELYTENGILFSPEFNIHEDIAATVRLCYFSGKIVHIPAPLYYYDVKSESLSKVGEKIEENNPHITDRIISHNFIDDFFRKQNALDLFMKENNYSKLLTRSWIIIHAVNKKPFLQLFPEANGDIWRTKLPYTKKIILFSSSKNWLIVVKIFLTIRKILNRATSLNSIL